MPTVNEDAPFTCAAYGMVWPLKKQIYQMQKPTKRGSLIACPGHAQISRSILSASQCSQAQSLDISAAHCMQAGEGEDGGGEEGGGGEGGQGA